VSVDQVSQPRSRTLAVVAPGNLAAGWLLSQGHFHPGGQYLFDNQRVFNAGNDVHGAAAFMAGFNIDVA